MGAESFIVENECKNIEEFKTVSKSGQLFKNDIMNNRLIFDNNIVIEIECSKVIVIACFSNFKKNIDRIIILVNKFFYNYIAVMSNCNQILNSEDNLGIWIKSIYKDKYIFYKKALHSSEFDSLPGKMFYFKQSKYLMLKKIKVFLS